MGLERMLLSGASEKIVERQYIFKQPSTRRSGGDEDGEQEDVVDELGQNRGRGRGGARGRGVRGRGRGGGAAGEEVAYGIRRLVEKMYVIIYWLRYIY